MVAKLDWEGMGRRALVGIGRIAARAGRAGAESVVGDVEHGLKEAEKKTRKVRDAIRKAVQEIDVDEPAK